MSAIVKCPSCGAKNRVKPGAGKPVCGKCKTPLPDPGFGSPVNLTDADFDAFLAGTGDPVLVDFWASWCGPCKTMGPVIDQFAGQQHKIRVAKVNTERNQAVPGRYAIRSIPTLVLFQGGKEIKRLAGAMPLPQLMNELKPWL